MKILYLTSMRLPSAMAHAVQVMKVCESLTDAGHEVTLFCTADRKVAHRDIYDYFGVRRDAFKLVTIPALAGRTWLPMRYKVHLIIHAVAALVYMLCLRFDVRYTRDVLPALAATCFPGQTVLEVHDMPRSWVRLYAYVLNRVDLIVSTTEWTKQALCERLGVDPGKITVEYNGVDERRLASVSCDMWVRQQCGVVKDDDKIVMYTGHLYDWKGAHVLAEAAKKLPPSMRVVFVGGTEADTQMFREKYGKEPNVTILGHKPYKEVHRYLACADVFVLPNVTMNVSNASHSKYATSPVKLFEYLCFGKQIVASDLPSLRSLVPEQYCVFVPENNPAALAAAVVRAASHPLDTTISRAMQEYARQHTWQKRSERILALLSGLAARFSGNT